MSARLVTLGADRREHPLVHAVVLGRDAAASIRVDDPHVSKRQAMLEPERHGWRIRDLGGKNAVRVNGEPLAGSRTLASGDHIAIGPMTWRFVDDAAASIAPDSDGMPCIADGTVVDRYRFEGRVGQGAVAHVYRARHVALGTLHAVKVLAVRSDALRRRLVQEGRIQAQFRHPNVVAVTDVIDVGGSPGLVMDFVPGLPLSSLLARSRLGATQVDAIVQGMLAGVAEAHRLGFVHRDLKPANVLVVAGESAMVARVVDFGFAKALDPDEVSGGPTTRTGDMLGTPAYMAPEQFRSAKGVDCRADVFSLGAILYELATGKRAFPGFSDRFPLGERPIDPIRPLAPELAEHRVRAIERAVSAGPALRFADAGELLTAWDLRP